MLTRTESTFSNHWYQNYFQIETSEIYEISEVSWLRYPEWGGRKFWEDLTQRLERVHWGQFSKLPDYPFTKGIPLYKYDG